MATQAFKLYKNSNSDTDKRVGINLTTNAIPSYALDVNGNIRISGKFNNDVSIVLTDNQYGRLQFYKNNTRVSMIRYDAGSTDENVTSGRFLFFQYSPTNPATSAVGSYEYYTLPAVTSGLSSAKQYNIITTKNLSDIGTIPVSQGGTGATTFTSGALLTGNGTSAITAYTPSWQAWTAGTTAGPKAKIKLGNVDYESAAIPSASTTTSGIVTTGSQNFLGRKGFGLVSKYGYSDSGNASQYMDDTVLYTTSGTQVGERWYEVGGASTISSGIWKWRSYSPNSTASGTTTGKYETYSLPAVTVGRTDNASYSIITSKGATMSGVLTFTGIPVIQNNGEYPAIRFKPNHSTNNGADPLGPVAIFIDAGSTTEITYNRMYFRVYSPAASSGKTTYTSYYDQFMLPAADIGKTGHDSYNILTSKSAVTIAQGGTGATTRLGALKALTNENVGTSATYFLTITDSWGKGGYTSVANAKTVLGLGSAAYLNYSGTIYGSGQMGWKVATMSFSSNSATTDATGVTTSSVIQATRAGDGSTGTFYTVGAASCSTAGTIRVNAANGSTLSGSTKIHLWWSKTATGG